MDKTEFNNLLFEAYREPSILLAVRWTNEGKQKPCLVNIMAAFYLAVTTEVTTPMPEQLTREQRREELVRCLEWVIDDVLKTYVEREKHYG